MPVWLDPKRQADISRSDHLSEARATGSELCLDYRLPHSRGNPLSPKDSPTGGQRMQSTHRQSVSYGRSGGIDPLPRPISREYAHRGTRSGQAHVLFQGATSKFSPVIGARPEQQFTPGLEGNQQLAPGPRVDASAPQRMMSVEQNGNDVRVKQQNAHSASGLTVES